MLIAASASGAFLVAASLVDPKASRAVDATSRTAVTSGASAVVAGSAPGTNSLGELRGKGHSLRITASPDGPRYTVIDEAGQIAGERLTAAEVAARFPDISLETLTASPALMLADLND